MAYKKTRDVAGLLLSRAFIRGINDVSPMKLQKLLYLANGWHLAIFDKPLVKEKVQAWKFGPVFPSLYRDFKRYGNQPIDPFWEDYNYSIGQDQPVVDLLDAVLDKYGHLSAIQLSRLTHQEETPWSRTWDGTPDKSIPDELIAEHFRSLAGH